MYRARHRVPAHCEHDTTCAATDEQRFSQADADLLTAMGCDEAQGYFFGKPMPLHELIVAVKRSWRV